MSRVIVVGGGVIGLCTGLLLTRSGHDVTVLERDPAVPPEPGQAWDEWERRGVNQFRLLHYFQSRFREELEANLPGVVGALDDAGALRYNPFREAPAEVTGGFRESDARFDALTARRPVAESAIASVVARDGVDVRRGVAVAGFLTGEPTRAGIPHVVGVRTEDGHELGADFVIDVGGRRSSLPSLLTDIGARAPIEERADCGFVYFGRHFKSSDGSIPFAFGPLLMPYGTISTLTLPSDNGTWGIGVIASADDKEMRRLKDVDAWTRVVKSMPLVAHWLDGEPLDPNVAVMAKIEDRHRTFVVDGTPVATGVMAVGDSWAATNPSVGRGISIGMIHAVALRDLLYDGPSDPFDVALAWHARTLETVEPWYRGTLAFDEGRLAEIRALLEGREPEASPQFEMTQALQSAAGKDPELLRAVLEIASVLTLPEEVFARPGVFEKVVELGGGWRDDEQLPGPSREELIAAVA
jgi:flavin-dependent dehydrogenase